MAERPLPLKPLSWYKKLATKKGRLVSQAFLVEGQRAIEQIQRRQPGRQTPRARQPHASIPQTM